MAAWLMRWFNFRGNVAFFRTSVNGQPTDSIAHAFAGLPSVHFRISQRGSQSPDCTTTKYDKTKCEKFNPKKMRKNKARIKSIQKKSSFPSEHKLMCLDGKFQLLFDAKFKIKFPTRQTIFFKIEMCFIRIPEYFFRVFRILTVFFKFC